MKTTILTPLIAIACITMLSNFRVVKGMTVQTINIEDEAASSLIEIRSAEEDSTFCNDVCNSEDDQTKDKGECYGCLSTKPLSDALRKGYYDGYVAGAIVKDQSPCSSAFYYELDVEECTEHTM